MHQWISSVNSYYYTYMIYHVTHERLVFPRLGIASDEKVVAHALPKVEVGLQVLERQLAHGKKYLLGADLTLADFYLVPCTFSFSLTRGRQGHVSQVPGLLPVAGDDGGAANCPKLPGVLAAARPDRARAGMGRVAPPEVLRSQQRQSEAEARSILPAHICRGINPRKGSSATSP